MKGMVQRMKKIENNIFYYILLFIICACSESKDVNVKLVEAANFVYSQEYIDSIDYFVSTNDFSIIFVSDSTFVDKGAFVNQISLCLYDGNEVEHCVQLHSDEFMYKKMKNKYALLMYFAIYSRESLCVNRDELGYLKEVNRIVIPELNFDYRKKIKPKVYLDGKEIKNLSNNCDIYPGTYLPPFPE